MKKHSKKSDLITLIPSIGIMVYCVLYVYASTLYPGGTKFDFSTEGFSWMHNYWCDILDAYARNGAYNPARPFGILANIILCGSLAYLFYDYGHRFIDKIFWRKVVQYCGIFSMILSCLIFTPLHNSIIISASLFGIFAMTGLLLDIFFEGQFILKIGGAFAIILLLLNNGLYYSEIGLRSLPIIQKISFGFTFMWFVLLNYSMIVTDKGRVRR